MAWPFMGPLHDTLDPANRHGQGGQEQALEITISSSFQCLLSSQDCIPFAKSGAGLRWSGSALAAFNSPAAHSSGGGPRGSGRLPMTRAHKLRLHMSQAQTVPCRSWFNCADDTCA
eukprot:1347292-Karenia_brevis.AAC.1